jgi:hypothetical protein
MELRLDLIRGAEPAVPPSPFLVGWADGRLFSDHSEKTAWTGAADQPIITPVLHRGQPFLCPHLQDVSLSRQGLTV